MGAWIEMKFLKGGENRWQEVALFMGAWIEIWLQLQQMDLLLVALFMGAWIEMPVNCAVAMNVFSRTLYGCVD